MFRHRIASQFSQIIQKPTPPMEFVSATRVRRPPRSPGSCRRWNPTSRQEFGFPPWRCCVAPSTCWQVVPSPVKGGRGPAEGREGRKRPEAGGQAPRQLRSPPRRASSQQTSKRSLVRAWGNRVAAGEGSRCATVEVCRFHSTPHFASLEVTEIERHDISGQKPSDRVRVPFIPP